MFKLSSLFACCVFFVAVHCDHPIFTNEDYIYKISEQPKDISEKSSIDTTKSRYLPLPSGYVFKNLQSLLAYLSRFIPLHIPTYPFLPSYPGTYNPPPSYQGAYNPPASYQGAYNPGAVYNSPYPSNYLHDWQTNQPVASTQQSLIYSATPMWHSVQPQMYTMASNMHPQINPDNPTSYSYNQIDDKLNPNIGSGYLMDRVTATNWAPSAASPATSMMNRMTGPAHFSPDDQVYTEYSPYRDHAYIIPNAHQHNQVNSRFLELTQPSLLPASNEPSAPNLRIQPDLSSYNFGQSPQSITDQRTQQLEPHQIATLQQPNARENGNKMNKLSNLVRQVMMEASAVDNERKPKVEDVKNGKPISDNMKRTNA